MPGESSPENSETDHEYHPQKTIPGPCRPDLAVPDAGRGGARRRVVLLYARRKTLLRPGRRSIGEQRRALQSCRREGRTGTGRALHARHGLRRTGRNAAGGVCRKGGVAASGRVVESLFRQFGRRSGRRGAQAGQTLYRTHGAGLHASCLPRVDPRVDEHDGGSRRRGVERSFPAPAARRAGNRIQRFRGVRAHHAPHGMRPCRTRAGRSGRPPACPGLSGGAAAPLRRSRGAARIR